MGIQELEILFLEYDISQKGWLSVTELANVHKAVHMNSISMKHINDALFELFGDSDYQVTFQEFGDVLKELARRVSMEEDFYWTFMAMADLDCRISVDEALLLFKAVHNEAFSLQLWNNFMDSRDRLAETVSFDEIKFWLINRPFGESAKLDDIQKERIILSNEKKSQERIFLSQFKNIEKSNERLSRERHEALYSKDRSILFLERKLFKWEKNGLTAFLADDTSKWFVGEIRHKAMHKVKATDILDLIDAKYLFMRKKLLHLMLRNKVTYVNQFSPIDEALMDNIDPNLLNATCGFALDRCFNNFINDDKSNIDAEISAAEFGRLFPGESSFAEQLVFIAARHKKERQLTQECLKSLSKRNDALLADAKVVHFLRLVQQLSAGRSEYQRSCEEEESRFILSVTALGLWECARNYSKAGVPRTQNNFRHLAIAESHLNLIPNELPQDSQIDDLEENVGRIDLLINICQELDKQHRHESQAFVYLLRESGRYTNSISTQKYVADELIRDVRKLRGKREEWRRLERSERHRTMQRNIQVCQEATVLKYWHAKSSGSPERNVSARLLAELHICQHAEFNKLFHRIIDLEADELMAIRHDIIHNRLACSFDCLAYVLLGSFELSPIDEALVAMLTKKYDALRRRLLLDIAMATKKNWNELSKADQNAAVMELVKMEADWRAQNNEAELVKLAVVLEKNASTLRELMGPSPSEVELLRKARNDEEDECFLKGQSYDKDYLSGLTSGGATRNSLLIDLINRQEVETEWQLHRPAASKTMSLQHLYLQIWWIRSETGDFTSCARICGLLERVDDLYAIETSTVSNNLLKRRPLQDGTRLSLLTQTRLRHRATPEGAMLVGAVLSRHLPTAKLDDISGLKELLWMQLNKNFLMEREFLIKYFEDADCEELILLASGMPNEDCKSRQGELRRRRDLLNLENMEDVEEFVTLIEEAGAMRYCNVSRLQSHLSRDEIIQQFLIELELFQQLEVLQYLKKIDEMDANELMCESTRLKRFCSLQVCERLFSVFNIYRGAGSDEEIMTQVEKKYDALRDKLLLEQLIQQLGKEEWARLQSKERQLQWLNLKLKERQYRREGDLEALTRLFGDSAADCERLRQLMGTSREVFQRKLQEKLARRQRRGVDYDSGIDEDEVEVGNNGKESGQANVLSKLNSRMEAEKQTLLGTSESEAQFNLLRLRRETLAANRAEDFASAATQIGLLERSNLKNVDGNDRPVKDRARQEERAKLKLCGSFATKSECKLQIDRNDPQGQVLTLLEEKHELESRLFVELLSRGQMDEDFTKLARTASLVDREIMFTNLVHKWKNEFPSDNVALRRSCLQEGVALKYVLRASNCGAVSWADEQIGVSLCADLLECQQIESESLLEKMRSAESDSLVEMQKVLIRDIELQSHNNIAQVVFSVEPPTLVSCSDAKLVEVLDEKYDQLRHQLLLTTLLHQYGEEQWRRLDEQEQQRKLTELRLQERKLRQEGRWDELEKLFGEALSAHEALTKILGRSKEEQARDLQEKLEKRRQRIQDGMSEEEADCLAEKEDDEADRQLRLNLLLDLQTNYDAEKNALFQRLRAVQDSSEAERLRMKELLRLRREAILVHKEDSLSAAALVLRFNSERERIMSDERQRQEELARLRVRARRSKGIDSDPSKADDVAISKNVTVDEMREAVMAELDLKHSAERWKLLNLLDACNKSTGVDGAYRDFDELITQVMCLSTPLIPEHLLSEAMAAYYKKCRVRFSLEDEDEMNSIILADLQQLQVLEASRILAKNAEVADLKSLKASLAADRKSGHHLNLNTLLFGAFASDALNMVSLEKVLSVKYDILKEKILLDCLVHRIGFEQWTNLSEQEKRARLTELKLEATNMEAENVTLLTQQLDKDLSNCFGIETEEKKSQRLAQRRRELFAMRALENPSAMEIEALLQREETERESMNILKRLHETFENERVQVLSSLKPCPHTPACDCTRQLEVAHQRNLARRIQAEPSAKGAILLLHARDNDEEIQRKLAASRISVYKSQMKLTKLKDDTIDEKDVLDSNEAENLRDANILTLMTSLESKYKSERNMLLHLLCNCKQLATKRMSGAISAKDLEQHRRMQEEWNNLTLSISSSNSSLSGTDRIAHLEKVRATKAKRLAVLKEAAPLCVHFEASLGKRSTSCDEAIAILLANLQSIQENEARCIVAKVEAQSTHFLTKLIALQRLAEAESWWLGVGAVLLAEYRLEDFNDFSALLDEELTAFQREKEKLVKSNSNELLRALEEQYAEKLKAIDAQRVAAKRRLAARREQMHQLLDQEQLATSLLTEMNSASGRQKEQQANQVANMREKLRQRRELRKKPQDAEMELKPSSPAMRKSREISATDKQEMTNRLMQQQNEMFQRITEQQREQQDKLTRRIQEQSMSKFVKTSKLLDLGYQQKTRLESHRENEKSRQFDAIQTRVKEAKYQKTLTMKTRLGQERRLQEEESLEMRNARMEAMVLSLQARFHAQEQDYRQGKVFSNLFYETETEKMPGTPPTNMSNVEGLMDGKDVLTQIKKKGRRKRFVQKVAATSSDDVMADGLPKLNN